MVEQLEETTTAPPQRTQEKALQALAEARRLSVADKIRQFLGNRVLAIAEGLSNGIEGGD